MPAPTARAYPALKGHWPKRGWLFVRATTTQAMRYLPGTSRGRGYFYRSLAVQPTVPVAQTRAFVFRMFVMVCSNDPLATVVTKAARNEKRFGGAAERWP